MDNLEFSPIPSTILKDNAITKEEVGMPEVFQSVIDTANDTRANFKDANRDISRIAVVVSAYDAKDVLPETLIEITAQIRQMGMGGEIFVVLNNGGGNTTDFVNTGMEQSQFERVAAEMGVDGVILGKTNPLTEVKPNSKALPRQIKLNDQLLEAVNGIKLVIIDQDNEPDNSGKIRGLRDVYELLRQQNQETGYCPNYLLAIDAETRLRPVDVKDKRIITDVNSGLAHMIDVSQGGKRMVGAKLQFVPYDENGNPNWMEKTPPMQESVSIMHGMKGYEWLPGGGTLGSFPEMVSVLSSISQKLPGTRIEDVLTTVTAKAMGIETVIDTEVVHANRCPSEPDGKAVFLQMERWLKGAEGLKLVTGKDNAEKVIKNGLLKLFVYPLSELARGKKIDVPHLLKGLPHYLKASRLAKGNPDDYVEGAATFIHSEPLTQKA